MRGNDSEPRCPRCILNCWPTALREHIKSYIWEEREELTGKYIMIDGELVPEKIIKKYKIPCPDCGGTGSATGIHAHIKSFKTIIEPLYRLTWICHCGHENIMEGSDLKLGDYSIWPDYPSALEEICSKCGIKCHIYTEDF